MSKLKARDPAEVLPGKTKGMIYGVSGVGKTWFTLTFPKPYFLDTEGGASLRHYQERLKAVGGAYLGPEDGALDFDFVISQMQALATEKHPYQTLIIDSITKLYQTAIAQEAERLGDKDVFGASKKPAIASMRRLVNWATRLDMNIWFVAHESAEWGMVAGQRQEIGRIGDVWDKMIYELHLTIQALKRGPNRIAVVRKSRLVGFPDADTFDLDYSEFATRYGKDYIEAGTTQIVLATTDQVAEMTRLIELLHVSEADIEKLCTKNGCNSIDEIKTEDASDIIDKMKKRVTNGGAK